jgi:hypothetical protein
VTTGLLERDDVLTLIEGLVARAGDGGDAILLLPGGQISSQGLFVSSDLFGGKTITGPVTGGSGKYRHARGDGTAHIPQDVPNLADAEFVLRLR